MPSIDPERQTYLRANEDAILAGLAELDAAEQDGSAVNTTLETDTVQVPPYGGRPGFSFAIRRLELEGWEAIERRNIKAKRPGEPVRRYDDDWFCDIIVEASTAESQRALWHNKARQERYGATTPTELVRKLIPKPGWRESVVQRVKELMGYGYGMSLSYGSLSAAADADLEQQMGE